MKKINILLLDDQQSVLETMQGLPKHFDCISKVRVAQNKEEFDELYDRFYRSINLILLDLMLDTNIPMSGRSRHRDEDLFSGIDLLKSFGESEEEANIAVHSQFFNHTTVLTCYKLGAKGFIPKGDWTTEVMVGFFQKIASGETIYPTIHPYDRILCAKLLAAEDDLLSNLNEREVAILSLLAARYPTDYISKELSVSDQIIYNAITKMCNKLEIEPLYDEKDNLIKERREVLIDIALESGVVPKSTQ